MEYGAFTTNPKYECDCTAIVVSQWRETSMVCIVKAHKEDAQEAERAAEEAVRTEASKRFDTERRKLIRALREPKGLLVEFGQRVLLYSLLRAFNRSNNQAEVVKRFQLRHGGEESVTSEDNGPLWETVSGLSIPDLGEELAEFVALTTLANPYLETSHYWLQQDAVFRQAMVDQIGLAADIVWGDAGRRPSHRVADRRDARRSGDRPLRRRGRRGRRRLRRPRRHHRSRPRR
jgi:hypothetical protein